MSHLQE